MVAEILFGIRLFAVLILTVLAWFFTIDCMALDWIITEIIKSKLRKLANKK
jgi:hypothetical protein